MESWNDGIMKERQKAVQIVKIVEVVQIAKTVINTGMMEYWNNESTKSVEIVKVVKQVNRYRLWENRTPSPESPPKGGDILFHQLINS